MRVWIIALNTFKEAIRDRILYLILFFAIIFIIFSRVLSLLTVGDELKIMKDVGLASISIFGVVMAVLIGTGLVYKEIDKKTIYTLLSKPVYRYEFLLGKFFGLTITLVIMLMVMSLIFFSVIFLYSLQLDPKFLIVILLTLIELMLITSLAILFSTFTTPILSSIFTFSLFLIGRFSWGLNTLIEKSKSPLGKVLVKIVYYILPNLEKFNLRTEIVHNLPISTQFLIYSILYGLCYTLTLLLLATIIFQKREFV
ncbi:MAG: ABC transporter permease [Candidatus Aminicenantia bacterium]